MHIVVSSCCQAILAIHISKTIKPDIRAFPVLLDLLGKKLLRNLQKLYGDKAYTSQFYQCKLWEEFSLRLVVERNAVRSETRVFPDLELYRNSPGLWKSSLDFSAKTFVELTFAKAQQLALPLRARKTENKRKQILCRFLLLNFNQVLKSEQK